jgi:hypothetical protein
MGGSYSFMVQEVCQDVSTNSILFNQVPLMPSSVIGGSGAYNTWTGGFNDGSYPAYKVTDQNSITPTETTGVYNMWLAPVASSNPYFVIDLGSVVPISSVQMFNTFNGGNSDRSFGTLGYLLEASSSTATQSAAWGQNLVSPVVLSNGATMSMTVTGGTQVGGIVTFLASGSFTVNVAGTASLLVVAGGASGGGRSGGGGGAGGVVYYGTESPTLGAPLFFPAGAYTVTVGAGGARADGSGVTGLVGGDSIVTGPAGFTKVFANGGGGGGSDNTGNAPTTGGMWCLFVLFAWFVLYLYSRSSHFISCLST